MSNTQQTLAQMIRAKYPTAYTDMSDTALEQAILAKHPEYSDLPRTSTTPTSTMFQGTDIPKSPTKIPPEMLGRTGEGAQWEDIPKHAKAALEVLGGTMGGELFPAAKGLVGALLRMGGAGLGTGAGNAAGQAIGTGTVNPKEALQAAGAGTLGQGIGEGLAAIPSAAAAGKSLQDIKATAGDVPIDMTRPGNTALELYEQSQRGASLPKVVRDFVKRATAPGGEPITYAEAKDFQSNVSQLSADERMALKPNTKRLLGQLNSDLKASLEDAADVQGKGEQFVNAMQEYHHAMQLRNLGEQAKDALWKAVLTGTGLYGAKKILESIVP